MHFPLCSKDDLDAALGDAHTARDSEVQAETRSKAERARSELAAAQAEVSYGQEWPGWLLLLLLLCVVVPM